MALIFALSSRPVPPEVDRLPDWVGHGLGWLVLGFLVARGVDRPGTVRHAVLTLTVAIGYGVLDEIHQSFVPGRTSDPLDVLKDAAGTVLGLLVHKWTASAPSGEVA